METAGVTAWGTAQSGVGTHRRSCSLVRASLLPQHPPLWYPPFCSLCLQLCFYSVMFVCSDSTCDFNLLFHKDREYCVPFFAYPLFRHFYSFFGKVLVQIFASVFIKGSFSFFKNYMYIHTFVFLGWHLQLKEVPRLGVQSEL